MWGGGNDIKCRYIAQHLLICLSFISRGWQAFWFLYQWFSINGNSPNFLLYIPCVKIDKTFWTYSKVVQVIPNRVYWLRSTDFRVSGMIYFKLTILFSINAERVSGAARVHASALEYWQPRPLAPLHCATPSTLVIVHPYKCYNLQQNIVTKKRFILDTLYRVRSLLNSIASSFTLIKVRSYMLVFRLSM